MDKPSPGPFKFILPHKQEGWGQEHFGDWQSSLSQGELMTLRAYAGGRAHEPINAELRASGGNVDNLSEGTRADVNDLDSALERAEIPEDIKAYRIMSDPAMLQAHADGDLVGRTFIDDGYTSTTINPKFLKGVSEDVEGTQIQALINVPKGTKGAYLGEASMNPEEGEVLLRRGTAFQVSDAKQGLLPSGGMGLTITLDILGQYDVSANATDNSTNGSVATNGPPPNPAT